MLQFVRRCVPRKVEIRYTNLLNSLRGTEFLADLVAIAL
jgi:hypothetical protein